MRMSFALGIALILPSIVITECIFCVPLASFSKYMHIKYVHVPVGKRTASLEASAEKFIDNHERGAFTHKDYESYESII